MSHKPKDRSPLLSASIVPPKVAPNPKPNPMSKSEGTLFERMAADFARKVLGRGRAPPTPVQQLLKNERAVEMRMWFSLLAWLLMFFLNYSGNYKLMDHVRNTLHPYGGSESISPEGLALVKSEINVAYWTTWLVSIYGALPFSFMVGAFYATICLFRQYRQMIKEQQRLLHEANTGILK